MINIKVVPLDDRYKTSDCLSKAAMMHSIRGQMSGWQVKLCDPHDNACHV